MMDLEPKRNELDARAGEPPAVPGGETAKGMSRRAFVSLGAGALLVALAPRELWRPRPRLHSRTIPTMGTLAEVLVVEEDAGRARVAIEAALDELRRVDRTMSRFDRSSDVGRINVSPVGEAVSVSAGTAAVVAAGLRWAEASAGRFDPGLAGAAALWDVGDRSAPPPEDAVTRYAGQAFYRELEVETLPPGRADGAVVVRRDPDVGVDLGGIAKGYAVDRAAAALRRHGIESGMVNAGGDLYALGSSPDGDPWKVGVRSPADPSRLAGQIDAVDLGVATSGDYQQYFDHAGRRYHHLLDPRTGAPREADRHSLTVTAGDCLTADAAATACFGLTDGEARRLLARAAPEARIA